MVRQWETLQRELFREMMGNDSLPKYANFCRQLLPLHLSAETQAHKIGRGRNDITFGWIFQLHAKKSSWNNQNKVSWSYSTFQLAQTDSDSISIGTWTSHCRAGGARALQYLKNSSYIFLHHHNLFSHHLFYQQF